MNKNDKTNIKLSLHLTTWYLNLQTVHHVFGQVWVGSHEDRKRRLSLSQTESAEQHIIIFSVHIAVGGREFVTE